MALMCPGCAVEYPEGYLAPINLSNTKQTMPICGCCMLEVSNRMRGTRALFLPFGSIPERMRRLAIDWRRETKQAAREFGLQL